MLSCKTTKLTNDTKGKFLPKVKIDVAIADDQLDEVIDVISKAAYTGKIGDGKIFVAELQRVIRIRTGEADEAAL